MSKLPAGLWMTAAPAELVKSEAASRRVSAASAQAENRVDRANRGFAFLTRSLPIWLPNQLLWETEPVSRLEPIRPQPCRCVVASPGDPCYPIRSQKLADFPSP